MPPPQPAPWHSYTDTTRALRAAFLPLNIPALRKRRQVLYYAEQNHCCLPRTAFHKQTAFWMLKSHKNELIWSIQGGYFLLKFSSTLLSWLHKTVTNTPWRNAPACDFLQHHLFHDFHQTFAFFSTFADFYASCTLLHSPALTHTIVLYSSKFGKCYSLNLCGKVFILGKASSIASKKSLCSTYLYKKKNLF